MSEISGGSAENDEMNTPETGGETDETDADGAGEGLGVEGGGTEIVASIPLGSPVPLDLGFNHADHGHSAPRHGRRPGLADLLQPETNALHLGLRQPDGVRGELGSRSPTGRGIIAPLWGRRSREGQSAFTCKPSDSRQPP